MIAVDWGTSSFRAYRMDGPAILDRVALPHGILHLPGPFAETLRAAIAPWLAAGERRVLMSGMVGSRQGWIEAPYLPCPAGTAELAAALMPVPFVGARLLLVPGVMDLSHVPEVMRGEEAELCGVTLDGLACLPGTHTKWAEMVHGRISGFKTHMTGEVFAALRQHTILGRLMQDDPHDPAGFAQGVRRAGEAGGLLHHLFGVRTLALMDQLAPTAGASYLSGLLLGHEITHAAPAGPVTLIGADALCTRYAEALALLGHTSIRAAPDAAARGLAAIGALTSWD